MPEKIRSFEEAKQQHDDFMTLLKNGAHLDESILPFDSKKSSYFHLTPVYEDGTEVSQ